MQKLEYGETKVVRVSRSPSPVKNTIDKKQLHNVEYLNWLGNMMKSDARCTQVIKSTISMVEVAFNKKKNLLTIKLNFNLRQKLVKCCIWSTDFYDAETRTIWKVDKKYLGNFEM
jgi:hypothetical protein